MADIKRPFVTPEEMDEFSKNRAFDFEVSDTFDESEDKV